MDRKSLQDAINATADSVARVTGLPAPHPSEAFIDEVMDRLRCTPPQASAATVRWMPQFPNTREIDSEWRDAVNGLGLDSEAQAVAYCEASAHVFDGRMRVMERTLTEKVTYETPGVRSYQEGTTSHE